MVIETVRNERGESLLETLITIVLMATAVTAVATALLTSVSTSSHHRREADLDTILRSVAETVKSPAVTYDPCPADYSAVANAWPVTEFTITVDQVKYWDGSSTFGAACSTDLGAQQITISVEANDDRASDVIDVVKRRP